VCAARAVAFAPWANESASQGGEVRLAVGGQADELAVEQDATAGKRVR